ncbi:MAG: thymidine kinase [bacterium]|nr:thymidine kinase [bacterium]
MIERLPEWIVERGPRLGSVEVICGCMFSGKTDELIRRVRRAPFARKNVLVFKPSVDTRRDSGTVNTYDNAKHPAVSVSSSKEILERIQEDTDWVAVDEAQFFDADLPLVCNFLASAGLRVIVAGLDSDFRGEPFGSMDSLMRSADKVDKQIAHCDVCGASATRTQRIVNGVPAHYNDPIVVVGAEESYQARCRLHHVVRKD